MKRPIAIMLASAVLALPAVPEAARAELLHAFDPSAGEFPESVVSDRVGNVYASLTGDRGEIRRFTRDGDMTTHFELDPAPVESFGILGLATDGGFRIYAAVASFNPLTHGVWRIGRTGEGFRIPGTEQIRMPNDLVFDRRGFLYVTDTIEGSIWRIGKNNGDGRPVERWVQDPLLMGDGSAERAVPLGANGIALGRHKLFVAVTERAHVVSIDIQRDGSAGAVEIFASHPDLFSVDGLTTDRDGVLYGAIVSLAGEGLGRIMRILPDDAPEAVLGPEDGLQFVTNLDFGSHGPDRDTLYVANWDVIAGEFGLTPEPAIHAFELDALGRAAWCPAP
jgi:sugar lactone lactonase YvrE